MIRWGNLQATPETMDKLHRLLDNPKTRAAVSRRLNRDSEQLALDCHDIAEQEIHRRPDDRRTPMSKSHGAHYSDSFVAVPARSMGVDKLRVGVRNTHPAHHFVERGTRAHPITKEDGVMKFPYKGSPATPGGPRSFGDWVLNYGDAGAGKGRAKKVTHPGAAKHRIMARAVREYRRRFQRSQGRANV